MAQAAFFRFLSCCLTGEPHGGGSIPAPGGAAPTPGLGCFGLFVESLARHQDSDVGAFVTLSRRDEFEGGVAVLCGAAALA